ncbi:MAG: hypothetical protein JNN15_09420 [Blastocatellia bacterium]|nr:hypothetical protein [Blastocatellia bacterium]
MRSKNGRRVIMWLLLSVLFFVSIALPFEVLVKAQEPRTEERGVVTCPKAVPEKGCPWTAVASTGAIDDQSLTLFAFDAANLGFKPKVAGTIVARYNVTNTCSHPDHTMIPGWTILEMGSTAPMNSVVMAQFYRVDKCTGKQTVLCTVANRSNPNKPGECLCCSFPKEAVDFSKALYYVEVTLYSSGPTVKPLLHTLRIY